MVNVHVPRGRTWCLGSHCGRAFTRQQAKAASQRGPDVAGRSGGILGWPAEGRRTLSRLQDLPQRTAHMTSKSFTLTVLKLLNVLTQ